MAKNTTRSQHKQQQRALRKRTKRRQKLSRRQTQSQAPDNPRQLLRRAREMPLSGAWVQRDWQRQGIAQVVVARTQPNDLIMFVVFLVDILCLGIKDSMLNVNSDPEEFANEALPRLYRAQPPTRISDELAHEIVWGAVEYAESLGLSPHRSFRSVQRILEPADALPRTGAVEFGKEGIPLYAPGPFDSQVGILKTLIKTVGIGNFYYVPAGEAPEEVVEMLDLDREVDPEPSDPALWVPDIQPSSDGLDTDSGLWVPGQRAESDDAPDDAEAVSIWTPGRS